MKGRYSREHTVSILYQSKRGVRKNTLEVITALKRTNFLFPTNVARNYIPKHHNYASHIDLSLHPVAYTV